MNSVHSITTPAARSNWTRSCGRPRSQRWTEAEKVALASMREAGAKNREIAERLGKTLPAVASQAQYMGPAIPARSRRAPCRPWTDAEKEVLVSMREAGATGLEIAEKLGKSEAAVKGQVKYSRLTKATRSRWTSADDAVLLSMNSSGEKRRAIAERLGRSEPSIHARIQHLEIQRRTYEPCDEKLEATLKKLHSEFSNAQIGRFIGATARWVENQYTRLGMTRDRATVAQRWAANLGHDLPPEVQELMQLRRQLVRKINAQSQY